MKPRRRRRVVVLATFVGADRSMGYRTGHSYALEVAGDTIHPVAGRQFDRRLVTVPPGLHNPMPCPYESLEAFLRQWTEIVSGRR